MVSVTAAVQGVVWVLVLTVVTLYAMGILTTRLHHVGTNLSCTFWAANVMGANHVLMGLKFGREIFFITMTQNINGSVENASLGI